MCNTAHILYVHTHIHVQTHTHTLTGNEIVQIFSTFSSVAISPHHGTLHPTVQGENVKRKDIVEVQYTRMPIHMYSIYCTYIYVPKTECATDLMVTRNWMSVAHHHAFPSVQTMY